MIVIEKKCAQCNIGFKTQKHREANYCSSLCREKFTKIKTYCESECFFCKKKFQKRKNNRIRFCSNQCRRDEQQASYEKNNLKLNIPTASVGSISELLACADLLAKGYDVFRAVSSHCTCDLVILNNNKLFRIEVTTGYFSNTGKLIYPTKKNYKFDCLIVVSKCRKLFYNPPIESLIQSIHTTQTAL